MKRNNNKFPISLGKVKRHAANSFAKKNKNRLAHFDFSSRGKWPISRFAVFVNYWHAGTEQRLPPCGSMP